MNAGQKGEFSMYITSVLAFYKQDVSPFVMDVWWAACEPYSMEQVRKAMTEHAIDPQYGQFAPKPADMVRALRGTNTDRAMVAWGKVCSAMGYVGAYRDVRFDEGIIHLVILDLGGWPHICRLHMSELGYLQHRFCESYRAYANYSQKEGVAADAGSDDRSRVGLAFPAMLAGDRSPDDFYLGRGLDVPVVVEVGSRQGCLQVVKDAAQSVGRASVDLRDALAGRVMRYVSGGRGNRASESKL